MLEFENSGKTYTNFIISSNSTLSVGVKPDSAKEWYNGNATGFTFNWKDDKFSIKNVSIKINTTTITADNTENEMWGNFLNDFKTACGKTGRGEHTLYLSANDLLNSGCLKRRRKYRNYTR